MMVHILRSFPIGIVLIFFVASCTTASPDATSNPSTLVKRDYHGLAEFDFGPDSIDSFLSEDLTETEQFVRASTLMLLARKTIPGASELGLVGVEGRPVGSATGWQCGDTEFEAAVAATVDPAAFAEAERAVAETHLAHLQRIRDSSLGVSATDRRWRPAATAYMIARLGRYETSGKPGIEGLNGKGMAWRSWMRTTLAGINRKAKQSGLSDARKEKALLTWLMCHISPSELEHVRDVLKDNLNK